MLAGKIIGLVVLAAMLKIGIGGPVEIGATGKIFCGPDGPVATHGNVFLLMLDVIRTWMFCSIRSSRTTASSVMI